jgi:hypothetical protein
MSEPRKRANTSSENDIGQERYELYKSAFSWVRKSIDEGYYLEAISIVESLVADRLESYLSFLLKKDCSFKTLGALIESIKANEKDELLRALVLNDLNQWRKDRNRAAHEMVKIEDGQRVTWDERLAINKTVAETGLALVRKIDTQIRKLR